MLDIKLFVGNVMLEFVKCIVECFYIFFGDVIVGCFSDGEI